MISLAEYRKDPCGSLSLSRWKWQRISLPDGMRIVHNREYAPLDGWSDEPYFRLHHDLKCLPETTAEGYTLRTALPDEIPQIVATINACYRDIQVTVQQVESFTGTPVYDGKLWVVAEVKDSGEWAGCGIADLDQEVSEGILEWIQVIPEYRRRGVGKMIVKELLRRMVGYADFVTVSGKCDDPSHPEMLYRSCGFTGCDIWHILKKA